MSNSPPAEAERVGGSEPDPDSGSFFALVAVGVVSGGEAERQVSHALNGTHQRPRGRAVRGSRS